MTPGKITGETRNLGAPPPPLGKPPSVEIKPLSIRDGERAGYCSMTSVWVPSAAELALLAVGHPITLTILGIDHPSVLLAVGTSADIAE